MRHDWPGNVRELANVLERAAMLAQGNVIESEDIVFDGPVPDPKLCATCPAREWCDEGGTFKPPPISAAAHDAQVSAKRHADAGMTDPSHPGKINGRWMTMAEMERCHIELTLRNTGYNQAAASRILEMDRSVLRRRIRKYGLDISDSTPGRPRKPR